MNQRCKVCGEPAAGFHFGAFTCEGCKSFFGRSFNNISSITPCKNNGHCVINKKNRTACKACRLQKCMNVGMSKSGSRYGRRSNWFKIHCLLQEQQQAALATLRGKTSPDHSFSLPFPPPFLNPETSSSIGSPDSESSEKGPPSFLPMPFSPIFLRPSPFFSHVFPYPTQPTKQEPTYLPQEEETPSKPILNNNNYDSKNNNLEKDPKRFYLDAILRRSPSPVQTKVGENDNEGQDIPIDLSVRSGSKATQKPHGPPITSKSGFHHGDEVKIIPLDLSV